MLAKRRKDIAPMHSSDITIHQPCDHARKLLTLPHDYQVDRQVNYGSIFSKQPFSQPSLHTFNSLTLTITPSISLTHTFTLTCTLTHTLILTHPHPHSPSSSLTPSSSPLFSLTLILTHPHFTLTYTLTFTLRPASAR